MNREQLRQAAQPKTIKVVVPDWNNAEINIRALSAKQIVEHSKLDEKTAVAKIIIASAVNDDGSPMFQDTPEDLAEVLSYGFKGCLELNEAIVAFNGLDSVTDKAKN